MGAKVFIFIVSTLASTHQFAVQAEWFSNAVPVRAFRRRTWRLFVQHDMAQQWMRRALLASINSGVSLTRSNTSECLVRAKNSSWGMFAKTSLIRHCHRICVPGFGDLFELLSGIANEALVGGIGHHLVKKRCFFFSSSGTHGRLLFWQASLSQRNKIRCMGKYSSRLLLPGNPAKLHPVSRRVNVCFGDSRLLHRPRLHRWFPKATELDCRLSAFSGWSADGRRAPIFMDSATSGLMVKLFPAQGTCEFLPVFLNLGDDLIDGITISIIPTCSS